MVVLVPNGNMQTFNNSTPISCQFSEWGLAFVVAMQQLAAPKIGEGFKEQDRSFCNTPIPI